MKRFLFLLAGLAVAASCQKLIEHQNINELQKGTVLNAEVEQIAQPDTKSIIELVESPAKAAKFKWSEGDEIAVMTEAGFKKFFLQANPNDASKIQFVSDEVCTPQEGAIYPFAAKSSDLTEVSLPASYGSTSTPYKEDTNMPMLASLEGNKLSFKHLGGVAMFTIVNPPTNASKFVFTANGKKITGEFELETVGGYKVINTSDSDGTNNAVTINFRNFASRSVTFYIPLPCGSYSGFVIQLQNASGNDLMHLTSAYEFNISRANVKVFNGVLFISDYSYNEGANSYMVPLNSDNHISISTKRVNAFWCNPQGGNEYANAIKNKTVWEPEVIWIEDTTGDITEADKSNVVFCDENGDPQSEFTGNVPFYVKANSATAKNILIGIKKKGTSEYLWSWHLWVTDYNPGLTPNETTGGEIHQYLGTAFQVGGVYEDKYVMDRNLGSTITSYNGNSPINPNTNAGIIGLYYQFGRKDPFKTQGEVTNTSGQKSYAYSVNNPDTFIKYKDNWHTPSNTTYPWNGSSNDKSIYDPCPAGWRVPERGVWNGFKSNFVWNDTDKGRLYNSQAWYPVAGYRYYSSSSIIIVGIETYYWSSSFSSADGGYALYFGFSDNIIPNSTTGRSNGLPVRCVQE